MAQMDTVEAIASSESLFDIEQVQLQFQIPSTIKKLLVSNNILYLILATGLVFKIDLENPETVTKIQLDLRGGEFKEAFLDCHGHHLIIQSTKSEFYYVNYKVNNYKHLSKLKGLLVSNISFFDECVGLNDTGPVLIGIATGIIYEYRIESNKETLFKQVWKSKDGIKYVGNALKYQSHGVNLYQVLIALTNNRLVQFNCQIPSKPVSSVSVFQNSFKTNALQSNFNNIELITGGNKLFGFLNPNNENNQCTLTFGNINFKSKNELHYLKLDLKPGIDVTKFLLTKYYILVLTSDNQLTIYNQLNLEKVSSRSLNNLDNNFEDFYFDVKEETYWMFSSRAVFEIVVDDENLGIWKLMVEKNMFDEALSILKHPKTTDKLKCDTILIKKGNYLIEKGDYITAAKILANTSESFDKITLKFMELEDKNILRIYLIEKLKILSITSHSQKYLISSWIVESYIEALNELDNKLLFSKNGKNNLINSDSGNATVEIDDSIAEKKKSTLEDFYNFLENFKDSLDKETIYQIILSHNRKTELLYFANLIQDFQFVLKYYINFQMWKESLNVLVVKQKPDLVYKCSTVLLVNYPVKTVDTWIRLIDDLDYMKLVPALLTYNKNIAVTRNILPEYNQAIRFLKFLINEKKVKNKIIHNTFFSILITYPNLENENLILKYLENQQNRKASFGKSDNYEILFDSDFIVRLCFRFNKIQSVIYIYSILGKYDEAVNLALDNDLIDVAILVADKPLESSSLERKNLWLKISEKLIQKVIANDKFLKEHNKLFELTIINDENDKDSNDAQNKQISNLLTFLTSKCEFLTIRDLLPLFPDFIVIDNFKEDIVNSLEKLSLEMSHLSNEMSSSLEESEKINSKIANFKKDSFQIVEPHESCLLCNKILSIRKFIVFPCFHSFHQDCLVKEIMDSNDYKFKNAIYKLQKKIIMNSKNKEVMEELKSEIDDLLSTACCLCTDIKINDIEEPLIKPGDKEQISWEI